MMAKELNANTAQMKSNVYERHGGYYSDFDGANGECAQCGVPVYNAPDIHDVHPIQMLYHSEAGDVFCEACFFDGYTRSGHDIADPVTETFYRVRVGHRTLYFENWQAASGFARREDDAEYLGRTEMEVAKLEKID